tara:strand:- start:59 stop:379 length:321 start_codon:yes stop_codon:yes gene_type:complete
MSFKVKVYYSNKKNGSTKKLTFHRVIRELKTGRPGIHHKNKAYPVFPFKEGDKKISTGKDEQGRMYVGEIKQQDTKFVVLIGHKKNQSKDYEYMKNNHPSKMIEDK